MRKLWDSQFIACGLVSLSLQISQFTKQSQFVKSLLICLIFYTPDFSHCFSWAHSSLSRSFLECYPQNCTVFFSLTITPPSTEITSCTLQAKLLFIHPSTAFASFSTTHNHVQLVILFYPPPNPFLQNCDLVDLSLHCIYVVHYSCQGTIVCACLYRIASHFFRVYLWFAKIIINSSPVLQQIHSPPSLLSSSNLICKFSIHQQGC